jgi:hypothetical protein
MRHARLDGRSCDRHRRWRELTECQEVPEGRMDHLRSHRRDGHHIQEPRGLRLGRCGEAACSFGYPPLRPSLFASRSAARSGRAPTSSESVPILFSGCVTAPWHPTPPTLSPPTLPDSFQIRPCRWLTTALPTAASVSLGSSASWATTPGWQTSRVTAQRRSLQSNRGVEGASPPGPSYGLRSSDA